MKKKSSKRKGQTPEIGQVMEDGMVYAGLSPSNGRPLYVEARDEPLRLDFLQATGRAVKRARERDATYRLPTAAELDVLHAARDVLGSFNTASGATEALYMSATTKLIVPASAFGGGTLSVESCDFKSGRKNLESPRTAMRVRFVRG